MFDYKENIIKKIDALVEKNGTNVFTEKELRKELGIGGVITLVEMGLLSTIDFSGMFVYKGGA